LTLCWSIFQYFRLFQAEDGGCLAIPVLLTRIYWSMAGGNWKHSRKRLRFARRECGNFRINDFGCQGKLLSAFSGQLSDKEHW